MVERAVLRWWQSSDGDWYVAQLDDPEIQRFTLEDASTTAEQFRSALSRLEQVPDQAGFAVIDPDTGHLAGNDVAGVCYWIAAAGRGRDLARRAVTEMCASIAERWPEVERATLWAHVDNVASQRVAEKAGFVHRPELDELKVVRGERWPVRWYTRSLRSGTKGPDRR